MQSPAEPAVPPEVVSPRAGGDGAPAAGVAADAAAAVARDLAADTAKLDPGLLVNRELSLLAFQWRVFEEVNDPSNPLLERVRFLSIVAANLDELFMIRVAGLEQQVAAGLTEPSSDGLTPLQQLTELRRETLRLTRALGAAWQDELLPALDAAGIHVLDHPQLDPKQASWARTYFDEMVMPVLTPLAFDPGRPFPHISNLSLNLAVLVEDEGIDRFARIKVPDTLPRLVPIGRATGGLDGSGTAHRHHAFVWLEQLVAAHVERLFPGVKVKGVHPFHVTRDAEMELQELEAADLLASVEHGVRERRFGSVVRLVVTPGMPDHIRDLLVHNLEIQPRNIHVVEGPLALSGVSSLASVERSDLKFPPLFPAVPAALRGDDDVFAAIRRRDVLIHHPFESFGPVVEFLRAAARDPDVLAIKMTLYRVGRNSPVVEALLEANQNRKQVAVLVELKARFDEESNIGWAKALEADGVHVIYGLLGLKTHSKIALVVRREGERLARYVHLSTGNYNPFTAAVYTDLGLFTADEEIGEDATQLFNYLTGYAHPREFRRLLVAPVNLRERLVELIERETEHARAGRGGHLVFKVNALADERMVEPLVRASRAGVQVDLLVRGICCLRPGVPGATENVRVTSVVGRFLEHSRIFWFRNAGAEEVYLGSADLMRRNLSRRVEVLFPVTDPALVRHLRDRVLATYLADNRRARRMRADGEYERIRPADGEPPVDAQARLLASPSAPVPPDGRDGP
ncbi:polyphosphate kinase 1 [Anaeromyxobacter sp. Fw109-5]|uniref:polyphosphate kinase 1 n=1 Tax=Anaeromyxobacter sp. (strain Fw109-5) TaxID=404589 RepID=UPI000158A5DB|nr:polyphosphate kinase 1 [Anaeromyxobacter sp. Fw109-5]ABS24787.1 Polyphosphate kinase [Anaeromyxobacter sp. Fw109-5]